MSTIKREPFKVGDFVKYNPDRCDGPENLRFTRVKTVGKLKVTCEDGKSFTAEGKNWGGCSWNLYFLRHTTQQEAEIHLEMIRSLRAGRLCDALEELKSTAKGLGTDVIQDLEEFRQRIATRFKLQLKKD